MTAVPPRPATVEVCRCGLPRGTAVHGNPFGAGHAYDPVPAAPDATAGDGLRSAIAGGLDGLALWGGRVTPKWWATQIADAVLALPALRDVLAAAARDAEAVAKVRELHAADDTEPHACTECGEAMPCCTTEALDPS